MASKGFGRRLHGPVEHGRSAAVERVSEGERRLEKADTVLVEWHRLEERRGGRQRVDGRAHVVLVTRERELGGSATPAKGGSTFDDVHADTRPGEGERRGKAVRTGPDNDGIVSVDHVRGAYERSSDQAADGS